MPTKKQINLTKQFDLISEKQQRLSWRKREILGQLCETIGVQCTPGEGPESDRQQDVLQLLRDCRAAQSSRETTMKTSDAFRTSAR